MRRWPWDWALAVVVIAGVDLAVWRALVGGEGRLESVAAGLSIPNPGLVLAVLALEVSLLWAAAQRGGPLAFWLGFQSLGWSYLFFYFGLFQPKSRFLPFAWTGWWTSLHPSSWSQPGGWLFDPCFGPGLLTISAVHLIAALGTAWVGALLAEIAWQLRGAGPAAMTSSPSGQVARLWAGPMKWLLGGCLCFLVAPRLLFESLKWGSYGELLQSLIPAALLIGGGCLLLATVYPRAR
jgi:hypothetical protein